MIYLKSLNLAYMPVPKAACTSVKAALAVLDPEKEASDVDALEHEAVHDIYPTQRFRPHRWETSKGAWRFTVVRDPVKRALSVYSNRIVDMRELHNSPRLRAQSELPLDPDPDFFFQRLEDYKALASAVKHHTVPMWLFTGRRLELYDEIYTTSDLGRLQDDLKAHIGQGVTLPRRNRSSFSIKLDDLAPETQKALRETTAPDYELFADYFQSPFR